MSPGPVPAIVVAGHTMALGVVRALGKSGVPVVVMHWDARDMAHVSRHVAAEYQVPPPQHDEARFVEALLAQAAALEGGVLVPASDDAVVALSRNKAALGARYVVAAPDLEVVKGFIEKRRTYALAEAGGVPAPRTRVPATDAEAADAGRELGFPLLVKPSQSHLYYERFHKKMEVVRTEQDLLARLAAARAAGLEVLVQEIVPGPDTAVVNYNAYGVEGRPLVEFTARQLRKAPPRFGSPRVVVSERVEEALVAGRALFRAMRLDGFACCEFKRDARDGAYRIVDVNGRHNLSGLLAVRCGINFPLIQYRHLTTGELPPPAEFRTGVYWVDVFRDAAYSVRHLLDERLSPWAYLEPYLRPNCDATFELNDLRPFLARARWVGRHALDVARGSVSP